MIIHMQLCKKPSYYSCQTSLKLLHTTWKQADEKHPAEHTAEHNAMSSLYHVAPYCSIQRLLMVAVFVDVDWGEQSEHWRGNYNRMPGLELELEFKAEVVTFMEI